MRQAIYAIRTVKKAAFVLPFLCSFAGIPLHAKPAERLVLDPITPWHVNWREESCALERAFGRERDQSAVRLEWFWPGEVFQALIVSNSLDGIRDEIPIKLIFIPGENERVLKYSKLGQLSDGRSTLLVPSVSLRILPEDFSPGDPLPAVAVEFEKKALQIEVESKARSLVFNTGALDKPFTAIRDCLRGLVKTWGLDPDVQESLKSPVEPENFPGSWVTPRDFPKEALANRASATVAFRVLVDETGAPTDCATQRAFSAYDFEEITCRLVMERARFVPAKNASGQPVASYYTNRVRWTPPPGRGR